MMRGMCVVCACVWMGSTIGYDCKVLAAGDDACGDDDDDNNLACNKGAQDDLFLCDCHASHECSMIVTRHTNAAGE